MKREKTLIKSRDDITMKYTYKIPKLSLPQKLKSLFNIVLYKSVLIIIIIITLEIVKRNGEKNPFLSLPSREIASSLSLFRWESTRERRYASLV